MALNRVFLGFSELYDSWYKITAKCLSVRKKSRQKNLIYSVMQEKKQSLSGKVKNRSGKVKKANIKKSEKLWTTEMMCQAIEAASNSMTLSEAARKFEVPKSTLSLN